MMISIASSTHHPPDSSRPSRLLVLVPPRHASLPLTYLGPGKHLIGSHEGCSIRVIANGVQQRHAMILVGDQKTLLKALDPRTWVNDSVVTESTLRAGDKISIGPITYLVRVATAEESRNYANSTLANLASTSVTNHPQPILNDLEDDVPVVVTRLVEIPKSPAPVPTNLEIPTQTVATSGIDVVEPPKELLGSSDRDRSPVLEPVYPQTDYLPVPQSPSEFTEPATVRKKSQEFAPVLDVEKHFAPREEELKQLAFELSRQSQQLQERTSHVIEREVEWDRKQKLVAIETERFVAREEELKQLASELSHQSEQLQDRTSHIIEREEELAGKQALFAIETERFANTAHTTRRELADEYARQSTLWQEWDASYRRAAEDLKSQLEIVEQRRTEFQLECEQLVRDRAELQRMQADCESERRAIAIERGQAKREFEDLHVQRSAFESERQQQSVALKQHGDQLAAEHQTLAAAQEELLCVRQQLEQDRTKIAADRSSESLRREQEIREHCAARDRLIDQETAVQRIRIDLESVRRDLEEQRSELKRERDEFNVTRSENESLRAQLSQAENELRLIRQSVQESQAAAENVERDVDGRRGEFEEWKRRFGAQQIQLDDVPFASSRSEIPLILPHSGPAVPPPIPVTDWTQAGLRERPPVEQDHLLPAKPHGPVASLAVLAMTENTTCNSMLNETTFTSLPFEMSSVNHSPMTSVEHEFTSSSSAIALDEAPSVDQTISEINHRFGFVSKPSEQDLVPRRTVEDLTDPGKVESIAGQFESTGSNSSDFGRSTRVASDPVVPAREPSLSSLRAQLAQMFDLPENIKSNEGISSEQNSVEPLRERAEEVPSEIDCEGSIEPNSQEVSFTGSQSVDLSAVSSSPISVEQSATILVDPPAEIADSENVADAEPVEEDAWTRRLRELSQVAGGSHAPSPPVPSPTPVNDEPDSPDVADEDEEYSVEAQLARLLGRPHNSGGQQREAASVAVSTPKAIIAKDITESVASSNAASAADRSHLTAEPTHRQNKSAVREEVQSFRAVAQMSARTALAKHSWNNLRSKIYFKVGITAASAVATAWYVNAFIDGSEPQLWKGITCGLATLVCSHRLFRTSFQMKQWRDKNPKQNGDRKSSATTAVSDPTTSTPE